MKTLMKLLFLILITFFSVQSYSQKPEPVYSFVRVLNDQNWYEQQAKLWKQKIDKNSNDKMAWVNFYKANRAIIRYFNIDIKKDPESYLMPLDEIIKKAEKAIPNSFELYYLEAYDKGSYTEKGSEYLLKAQQLRPFDKLILSDLMNYYQFQNDKANIELVSTKWFESNEMPQEILITAYNNLVSLDANAILLVNGDNDTYPYWILQNVQKIRPDVLILNVSLSLIDPYREKIFKENSISQLTLKNDSDRNSKTIVKFIFENVSDRPVYVSVFVDQDIYKNYIDRMYLTGLSFKYSDKTFDNLAILQNNFENKFMLDFLKQSFYYNYAQSAVNQMNSGYLAIFLKLYEHYLLCGETVKAQNIKELAKTVSEDAGNNVWMKYFEK